jgi:hypothetical protein
MSGIAVPVSGVRQFRMLFECMSESAEEPMLVLVEIVGLWTIGVGVREPRFGIPDP